jgi:RNA polymerase sigma-70 factor (ECF subfamily)
MGGVSWGVSGVLRGAALSVNHRPMDARDSKNCPDESLMRRFVETLDEESFRILAERHYERALRAARGHLDDDAAACDAVQETLIRVVRHRQRYDAAKPFAPWFFAILRNVCADHRRKEARHLGALVRLADRPPANSCGEAARRRADSLLEALGGEERRLLDLRYAHGLSVAETAAALGCSVEAAKKRFQRAISRLQSFAQAT